MKILQISAMKQKELWYKHWLLPVTVREKHTVNDMRYLGIHEQSVRATQVAYYK